MTPVGVTVAVRRLWPRRVRTRLAVFYAVLFLLVGVVLLALTYTLAAAVLVPGPAALPKHFTPQERALLGLCKPLPTSASVPAEQVPTLFEPFARANQRLNSSDGVGLGLSIASAIARAHNATITARPRPGGGLEMSVTIPANPS
jgi:hypothetical protein